MLIFELRLLLSKFRLRRQSAGPQAGGLNVYSWQCHLHGEALRRVAQRWKGQRVKVIKITRRLSERPGGQAAWNHGTKMNLKHWLQTNEIQNVRRMKSLLYVSALPPRCDPPRTGLFTQRMKSRSWVKNSDYTSSSCSHWQASMRWRLNVGFLSAWGQEMFVYVNAAADLYFRPHRRLQSGCSQSAAPTATNLKTNKRQVFT